jgi:hypothetical protein
MNTYTGRLTGITPSPAPACNHQCAHCGKEDTNLLFSMIRNADVQITRDHRAEHYKVHGIAGTRPYVIHAEITGEQIEVPPPPPEVWLVYKHGGAYHNGGDSLQGIYSSEEGAKDSVRFSVKDERRSLARRLGQPETPHKAEEPELRWMRGHHWRYGDIPGEFHAEAGLADFTVKMYKVPEGYLPRTTWCKVPHSTEKEEIS